MIICLGIGNHQRQGMWSCISGDYREVLLSGGSKVGLSIEVERNTRCANASSEFDDGCWR